MEKKHRNFLYLLVLVLGIALSLCYAQLNDLNEQLHSLRNEQQHSHISLQSEIQSIYDNVEAQLQAEASLLNGFSCEAGELDPETHRVALSISLVPKKLSEEMKCTLLYEGESVECHRNGAEFRAELLLPLFREEESAPLLCIETAEGTETEYLQGAGVFPYWGQYLPSLYAEDTSGRCVWQDGELHFDTECILTQHLSAADVPFVQFHLLAEKNGEEIWSRDITAQVQDKVDAVCWLPFSESFSVSEGDRLILSVLAEDARGYLHKYIVHDWYQQENASFEGVYTGEQIYDAKGELLHQSGY